jgi:hypothetical protein
MPVEGWQVRAYFDNVHHKAQESRAKVDGTTMMKTQRARMIGFPVLAVAEGETPTSRFAPTPNNTPAATMRWAFPTPWRINLMEDQIDEWEHMWQAESEYVTTAAAALNRTHTSRLITAARGDATETTEDTFGAASTVVALPAAQKIAAGTTGLTRNKIIQARAILDTATGGDVEVMGPYFLLYHPEDIRFLLTETQFTSLDYVSRQALMEGKPVQGLMGFNWIPTTQMPTIATTRYTVAYAKMGMGCGKNAEVKMRAGERADLSYAMQVFREDKFNYVRVDDKMVVEIGVDTTASPA